MSGTTIIFENEKLAPLWFWFILNFTKGSLAHHEILKWFHFLTISKFNFIASVINNS